MDYFDQLTSNKPRQTAASQLASTNQALSSQSSNMRGQIYNIAQQKKDEQRQEEAAKQANWNSLWDGLDKTGKTIATASMGNPVGMGIGFAMNITGILGKAIQGIAQMGD